MAKILDGKKLSEEIKNELVEEVIRFEKENGIKPGLAVIMVGENPASQIYVRNKIKACDQVGIKSISINMDDSVSTTDIIMEIEKLNKRPDIHGILVQLPLPKQIDERILLESIAPEKDVDGFHPFNMGSLVAKQDFLVPATPAGIMEILKREGISMKGKNATIVGHSEIVGKPLSLLFLNEWATSTTCHIETRELKEHTIKADILVVATGVPYLIKEDMVKKGAVVIDVGINRITAGKANPELLEWRKEDFEKKGETLIGDVDFLRVQKKASYITPVPGGVGPMTIAMLLSNTVKLAIKAMRKEREMKECLGEFKGMSKDEIIDTYDEMVEKLLNRVSEMQDEIYKLKKEIEGNGKLKKAEHKKLKEFVKAKDFITKD
jgi:methylenetetrahydrofolate dehydrogenase (NADP+)/methenyltetrahydrofolate cyclohydrolase